MFGIRGQGHDGSTHWGGRRGKWTLGGYMTVHISKYEL